MSLFLAFGVLTVRTFIVFFTDKKMILGFYQKEGASVLRESTPRDVSVEGSGRGRVSG